MKVGVSCEVQSEGYAPYIPDSRRTLKTSTVRQNDNNTRLADADAEAKIFEQLNHETDGSSTGLVRVYASRNVCTSCQVVASSIAAARSKVRVEFVVSNEPPLYVS